MTWLSQIKKNITLSTVELLLIVIILIFGSIMVIMTPLGAGFDEDQHFVRLWQISSGTIIPEDMSAQRARFPEIYFDLSYRKQPIIESVGFDYWKKYGGLKPYDKGIHYGPVRTRSNYSPILYLPQALVLRYLRIKGDSSALTMYFASRFAGLFAYMFLALIAIRLIPYGKWLLFVLALTPMAIYQASIISADTISNGIGLVFIGGCLYLQDKKELSWKDFSLLVVLIALLFFTKPNLFPLIALPYLILRPSRFSRKSAYPLLIVITIVLFMIEVIGWWNATSANVDFLDSGLVSSSVNAQEQVRNIISNPLILFQIFLYSIVVQGPRYIYQWIGVYGYDYGNVPEITYLLYLIGLGLALLLIKDKSLPDKHVRFALIVTFIATYVATLLSLYVTFTTVGEKFVYGVQGRYLIPVFPLLFLGLSDAFKFRLFVPIKLFVVGSVIAASLFYVGGLILNYHVSCGPSYFLRGLCYQPVYKNFAPLLVSSPPISKDVTLIQEIVPVCDGMTMI